MLFPETGLYWMMPSPAIPNFETALLYPGTCLTEATNISEGRGTSAPFELIGAPFINGAALADRMNAKKLPGVIFTAAYFTPSASKHAGRRCEGVHIHLTDTKAMTPSAPAPPCCMPSARYTPTILPCASPKTKKPCCPSTA